jgi:hypothetical protein
MAFATEKLSDKQIAWQVALRLVRARLSAFERRTGYQSYSNMVRHTELSPTG